jgi:hypothetical protein
MSAFSSINVRRGQKAMSLFTIALLSSAYAVAADFSGKWSSAGSNSATPMLVVLRQDGPKLTGSAGPTESRQFPIVNGTVESDHLVFEVKMSGGTIRFDLVSAGAELKGTARLSEDDGHTDNMNLVLKRIP